MLFTHISMDILEVVAHCDVQQLMNFEHHAFEII